MKLVECVPNFSEGRDRAVIDRIAQSIAQVDGAELLDVDPGAATNRTVVTFVGTPEAALEAAFQAIKTASELIDMSKHKGAHARMGATDVCPFVPVSDITVEECVELANRLGKRVGDELGIPVYLYEYAATKPERRNLATVRSGEYEGLAEKLKDPEWKPDYGPARFNPRSGATVVGVREFLIAYNINLNTKDTKKAQDIALDIREAGRIKRDERGKFVRDENGTPIMVPGKFKNVKAVGWYIEEYGRAQISINFTNYRVSPPHLVFDEVCRQAEKRGLRVTGSELVGLIPLEAMLMAGKHYLKKQNRSTGIPESEIVEMAVMSLGLNDIAPFDPAEKIIEYRVRKSDPTKLREQTLSKFADALSTDSPAPGGGSVAALCGSLAAALCAMVSNLTHGKKKHKEHWSEMEEIGVEAQSLKDFYVNAIDADTDAFNAVIAAMRMPKNTEEAVAARNEAILEAYKKAALVPLSVMEKTVPVLELAAKLAAHGNPNSLSDAGVAALCALTAAKGAYYNVLINLPSVEDEAFVEETKSKASEILAEAGERATQMESLMFSRLEGALQATKQ